MPFYLPVSGTLVEASGSGLFRGEWAEDEYLETVDLSEGIPAFMTGAKAGGSSQMPAISTVGAAAQSGAPSHAEAILLNAVSIHPANWSAITFPMSTWENSTRIKFWMASNGGSYEYSVSQGLKDGATPVQVAGRHAWAQYEIVASGANVVGFRCIGNYGVDTTSSPATWIAGIDVYAQSNPYNRGEFVLHDGLMWRCDFTGTGAEPGTNPDWVEVPITDPEATDSVAAIEATLAALTDASIAPVAPNDKTSAGFTFVLADKDRLVTSTTASAHDCTIPPDTYSPGHSLQLMWKGAGQPAFKEGAGVTFTAPRGKKVAVAGAVGVATCIAANTWVISGDVAE